MIYNKLPRSIKPFDGVNKVLAPGEFIFQADTGEYYTFGNELWHYVTPIELINTSEYGIRVWH